MYVFSSTVLLLFPILLFTEFFFDFIYFIQYIYL